MKNVTKVLSLTLAVAVLVLAAGCGAQAGQAASAAESAVSGAISAAGSAASEAVSVAGSAASEAVSVAGSAASEAVSAAGSAASEAVSAVESAAGEAHRALTPIYADQIRDGVYDITVKSSSDMFRVVGAKLYVENGSMHCVMRLSGVGYGKLFMGTSEEAEKASEDAYIPFVEDEELYYTYDCPIEALDKETDCAAWSIKKEKWYDRVLVYESDELPADALLTK